MATLRTLVDDGTGAVPCPPRGRSEWVGTCADCQWLLDVSWQDGLATVRCAPPPPLRYGQIETAGELVGS